MSLHFLHALEISHKLSQAGIISNGVAFIEPLLEWQLSTLQQSIKRKRDISKFVLRAFPVGRWVGGSVQEGSRLGWQQRL